MKKRWLVIAALAAAWLPLHADGRYASESTVEMNKGYVQERLVHKALEYLGTPYRYAGASKKGVDCSGFIGSVYTEAAGKKLARGTEELYASLPKATGALVPGDLVFFDTTGGVSHVGMAIGGSRIIHAASRGPATGVIISSLEEKYYRTRCLGARRVFKYTAPILYVTLGATRIGTELAAALPAGKPVVLAVDHRRKSAGAVHCRLIRRDGEKKKEMKKIPIEPGKSTRVTCSFEEAGAWLVSFTEEKTGEIIRIEVTVERPYTAAAAGKSNAAAGTTTAAAGKKP